ncbi:hypothetical protein ALC57_15502 [Trachymyrmex cornetzi]|uniref:MADF domain-containing protein n=1 Tax=Trachymyrmex cornetzi TaxID=471704 RepID=A0A151IWZ7_9HYME|nr:hypothetical protein ALC57_15502 [Trachymyrmex cornetzi]
MYCGWCLKECQIFYHSCFADIDNNLIYIDNDRNIFIAGKINIYNVVLVNFIDPLLVNIIIIENETDCNKKNNIGCNKEQIDEDLIAAVKSRPALYDFRLPLKERGRKHKDALWKEISEYLKGMIYIDLFILYILKMPKGLVIAIS